VREKKMKKVKYTGTSASGILLTTAQGYAEDTQFNPGVCRLMADEDAERLGTKYPDIFEVYEPVKKNKKKVVDEKKVEEKPKITGVKKGSGRKRTKEKSGD